jgi:hypothetical protein
VPPDPAGAGRKGVDEVDIEGHARQQLRRSGRDPLQQPRPARSRADDRDRGALRRHGSPRAAGIFAGSTPGPVAGFLGSARPESQAASRVGDIPRCAVDVSDH